MKTVFPSHKEELSLVEASTTFYTITPTFNTVTTTSTTYITYTKINLVINITYTQASITSTPPPHPPQFFEVLVVFFSPDDVWGAEGGNISV